MQKLHKGRAIGDPGGGTTDRDSSVEYLLCCGTVVNGAISFHIRLISFQLFFFTAVEAWKYFFVDLQERPSTNR